jgi:arginyl-tRNA synthetase
MLPIQKDTLETLLAASVKQVVTHLEGGEALALPKVALERPKVAAHGDAACNVAMQIAKPLKKNPR